MDKKLVFLFGLCAGACTALAGCSSSRDESAQDKIITGYLVENAAKYVTVANYKEIEIVKPVYTISEDAVDIGIEELLYSHIDYTDPDRPAQLGDSISMDVTAIVRGEGSSEDQQENYTFAPGSEELNQEFILGSEEFGEEFDEHLQGCQPGDHLTFSCSYEEDSWFENWSGKTVDFDVTVKAVQEIIIPEYDDAFVKDTMGFDSKEELEASILADLNAEYADLSEAVAKENLIQTLMEESTFDGYPDQLYDTCKEELSADYGSDDDTSDDDTENPDTFLEEETLNEVHRRLLISALCEAEQVEITEADLDVFADDLAPSRGFQNKEELLNEHSREKLIWELYTDKVSAILLNQVTVEEIPDSFDIGIDLDDPFAEEDIEELKGFEMIYEDFTEDFAEESSEAEEEF